MARPTCIGIAGGTGSGKTSIARQLSRAFGPGEVVILEQDAYYNNLGHLPLEERAKTNFDHPSSIDFQLFTEHIKGLLRNESIAMPVYDFTTHTRLQETKPVAHLNR